MTKCCGTCKWWTRSRLHAVVNIGICYWLNFTTYDYVCCGESDGKGCMYVAKDGEKE